MDPVIDESQEANVPELAIRALQGAQARVRALGRPQVLVVQGQLVRIADGQQTVLKTLPPRKRIPLGRGAAQK